MGQFEKGFFWGAFLNGGSSNSGGNDNSGCLAIVFIIVFLGGLALLGRWYMTILGIVGIGLYPALWDYYHDFGIGYKGLVVAGTIVAFVFTSILVSYPIRNISILIYILMPIFAINLVILIGRLLYYIITFLF